MMHVVKRSTRSWGRAFSGLSQQAIDVVKATTPVVGPAAKDITKTFYKTMFANNPEVLAFFNQTNQLKDAQSTALADAVCAYAVNIENLGALGPAVEKIAHRHVALNILPEHYPVVHKNMMTAIGKTLGDAVTPEIAEGWSEAVLFLAKVCIDTEEQLYQTMAKRAGGWRGEKEFVLTDKRVAASGTVSFDFKRQDYNGPYEYEAGQYLTIRLPEMAPRHYTLTSKPGSESLQCTVRKLDGGHASTYMHDKLQVGDKVLLGVPAGVFTSKSPDTPKVLLSAGIGITPSYAFLQSFGPSVKHVFHVDHSPERHAFSQQIQATGVDTTVKYTKDGRPDLGAELGALVGKAGKDAEFFICGPNSFMSDCTQVLQGEGCTKVFSEVFGTGDVQQCPLSAAVGSKGKCPVAH